MTVRDNTATAEGLGNLFEIPVRSSANSGKQLATKLIKTPGRALEIGSKTGSAAASKNPKPVSSTITDFINFYYVLEGLYFVIIA